MSPQIYSFNLLLWATPLGVTPSSPVQFHKIRPALTAAAQKLSFSLQYPTQNDFAGNIHTFFVILSYSGPESCHIGSRIAVDTVSRTKCRETPTSPILFVRIEAGTTEFA